MRIVSTLPIRLSKAISASSTAVVQHYDLASLNRLNGFAERWMKWGTFLRPQTHMAESVSPDDQRKHFTADCGELEELFQAV